MSDKEEKENTIANLVLLMDKMDVGEFIVAELDKPYRRFMITRLSETNVDERYPKGLKSS
jgi:hypothetical protein